MITFLKTHLISILLVLNLGILSFLSYKVLTLKKYEIKVLVKGIKAKKGSTINVNIDDSILEGVSEIHNLVDTSGVVLDTVKIDTID